MLSGGCQCGVVRYRLTAIPEDVHLCHCRMCQKAMGNLFAALAPVRLSDFRWTRGMPTEFHSSSAAIRQFCAACGTPLSFRYVRSGYIALTIGSFDEPARVRPAVHYGVEAWLPWLHEIFSTPLLDETTQDDTPSLRGMVNFQHPDHETDDGWHSKQN